MTLCIWPVAPDRDGDGAAQRAWYMLRALAAVEPVDLVILQQTDRPALAQTSLEPARGIARSVRFVPVPQWCTSSARYPAIPSSLGRVMDQARITSVETPRLARASLARIAAHLPDRPDTVFAGRLTTACIVEDLCRAGLLRVGRRFVDFDDIMSRFRRLQIERQAPGAAVRCWQSLIAHQMERAEARIARSWDGCAVASAEDVGVLSRAHPGAHIVHFPNVVERAAIGTPGDGPLRLLFVGNLSYPPNVDGLHFFLDQVWPALAQSRPDISLTVVGRSPDAALAEHIRCAGATLHMDVESVAPFYAEAHAVIAPIFFGGGTRVKIIEAMAFGRPIVATRFGVEGIAIRDGVHALLGDTAAALHDAVIALADDPALRVRLAARARDLHQERYGAAALEAAVRATFEAASLAPRPDAALRAEARVAGPRSHWALHDQAVAA